MHCILFVLFDSRLSQPSGAMVYKDYIINHDLSVIKHYCSYEHITIRYYNPEFQKSCIINICHLPTLNIDNRCYSPHFDEIKHATNWRSLQDDLKLPHPAFSSTCCPGNRAEVSPERGDAKSACCRWIILWASCRDRGG